MKQSFVTFYSPGTFVHEESTYPVESWDVEKAKNMALGVVERHNATPFCFVFSVRSRSAKELDSKETKRSGRYYLGGTLMTAKQVQENIPNCEILLSNMRCNNWKRVVVNDNSWRIVQPFKKDDVLLDFTPNKKKNAA